MPRRVRNVSHLLLQLEFDGPVRAGWAEFLGGQCKYTIYMYEYVMYSASRMHNLTRENT